MVVALQKSRCGNVCTILSLQPTAWLVSHGPKSWIPTKSRSLISSATNEAFCRKLKSRSNFMKWSVPVGCPRRFHPVP